MKVYGSALPRIALAAGVAGTHYVDLVVVGDSNVLYASQSQRGLQGGLCNAIDADSNLNHYGSGVVSFCDNFGDGSNIGNNPTLPVTGYSHGGFGTTSFADLTGAPAGAIAELDGGNYTSLSPSPLYLADGESLANTASMRLTKANQNNAVKFVGRYWNYAEANADKSLIGVTIRNNVTPFTIYADESISAAGTGSDGMQRFEVDVAAGTRTGVTTLQILMREDLDGGTGCVGPLYLGPCRAFYPDYAAGNIACAPLNWGSGYSLYDIAEDLVSTEAKRTGIATIMGEVAYPASVVGRGHHTVFLVTSLANDINETGNSYDGVHENQSPEGYIANLLYLREQLFASVPEGSTASMIVVPTPPMEYSNDATEAAPIRAAVAEYCRTHPKLGMMALNFDEVTDAATMRAAGYYSGVSATAHLSATGYDWEAGLILDAVQNGMLVAVKPTSHRRRRDRRASA